MLSSFMKFASGKWSNVNVSESDPMPVNVINGGNNLSVLIVEDALGVKHVRREIIDEIGTVTITYENFDGTATTPTAPITVASVVLPIGASTSAKQDELQGTQGTGASYNPPTGGSGVFGWLSGIYREIVNGIKLKLGGADISASNPLPVSATSNVVTSTKTFAAVSEYLALPITKGATSFSVFTTTASGSFNAVFAIQFSIDSTDGSNGTWISTSGRQQNISAGSTAALLPALNISNSTLGILTDIPIGSIYARVVCTSFTTGPVVIIASLGIGNTSGVSVLASPIPAGTNKIGFVQASGIQYVDTTTALDSRATFTSMARDLTATTAAATFASASTAAKSVSVCVVQDVAFTLQLLGSTDNFAAVSEIYRSISSTSIGSNHVVEVDAHSPAWRYFQYKIVNGVFASARTRGVSKFLAN